MLFSSFCKASRQKRVVPGTDLCRAFWGHSALLAPLFNTEALILRNFTQVSPLQIYIGLLLYFQYFPLKRKRKGWGVNSKLLIMGQNFGDPPLPPSPPLPPPQEMCRSLFSVRKEVERLNIRTKDTPRVLITQEIARVSETWCLEMRSVHICCYLAAYFIHVNILKKITNKNNLKPKVGYCALSLNFPESFCVRECW